MEPAAQTPTVVDREEESRFRRRVQMDFTMESYNRLAAIKDQTKAQTLARVIRQAVVLIDWWAQGLKKGYTLQMKGPGGAVIEPPDLNSIP